MAEEFDPTKHVTKDAHEKALQNAAEAERRAAKVAQDAALAEAKAVAEEAAAKALSERDTQASTRIEKVRTRAINAELRAAAIAAGIMDLDLVSLVDKSKIKVDDDDNIVGVDEAIAALKASKPKFFEAEPEPKKKVTGDPTPAPKKDVVVDISKLSKEDYAKRKSELRSRLRSA